MKKLGAEKWIDFKTEKDLVKAVQACVPDGLGPHTAVVASAGGAGDLISILHSSVILG